MIEENLAVSICDSARAHLRLLGEAGHGSPLPYSSSPIFRRKEAAKRQEVVKNLRATNDLKTSLKVVGGSTTPQHTLQRPLFLSPSLDPPASPSEAIASLTNGPVGRSPDTVEPQAAAVASPAEEAKEIQEISPDPSSSDSDNLEVAIQPPQFKCNQTPSIFRENSPTSSSLWQGK